jgi:hypothetical protein
MIFIKAHEDFDLSNLNINKSQYDEFRIICRNKLNDKYDIKVICDDNNYINKWSNLYGDLTYHYYVYTHINEFDDIIGFIQYKRTFNENILTNYKTLLNDNEIILPSPFKNFEIIKQFNNCHVSGLLEQMIDIIHEYYPEYKKMNLYNIRTLYQHNMFIMKKQDYIEYCKFMFWCYDMLNAKYNIYKKVNNKKYYRILSFLGERISSYFYINYFKKIVTSYVPF